MGCRSGEEKARGRCHLGVWSSSLWVNETCHDDGADADDTDDADDADDDGATMPMKRMRLMMRMDDEGADGAF